MSDQSVVQFQSSNLPATLQARLSAFTTSSILSSLGASAQVDKISIRGGRFRIAQVGMDEVALSQLHLDGVIVYANPNVNHAFYTKAYNKDELDQAPDCASSNGYGPDAGVKSPQSQQCATCPQAIWGSKISPAGKKIKACSESQLIGFIPIDPTTNNFFMVDGEPKVFRISVPAGSLKNLGSYAKTLAQRGFPLEIVLTRITFDESADGQRLVFAFNAALPEQAAVYILDYIDQNKDMLDTVVASNIKAAQNVQVQQSVATQAAAQIPGAQVQAPIQQAQVGQVVQPQPAVQTQPSATPNFSFAPQPAAQPAPAMNFGQPAQQAAQAPTMQPAPAIGNAPQALMAALQNVMG